LRPAGPDAEDVEHAPFATLEQVMNKSAAKIAVAALAIPLFGGFATYAAAQVSSKPAPQVVIPSVPTTDDRGGNHQVSPAGGHDVNDDNRVVGNGDDATDAGIAKVSDDPATHDATDDHGDDAGKTTVSTPTSIDDHGNDAVSSPVSTPTSIDDHGHDVTPTTTTGVTTPTSIDDHGGSNSGRSHG
jgi:hypothetical protein